MRATSRPLQLPVVVEFAVGIVEVVVVAHAEHGAGGHHLAPAEPGQLAWVGGRIEGALVAGRGHADLDRRAGARPTGPSVPPQETSGSSGWA